MSVDGWGSETHSGSTSSSAPAAISGAHPALNDALSETCERKLSAGQRSGALKASGWSFGGAKREGRISF